MARGVEPTSRSFTKTRAPEGRDSTERRLALLGAFDALDGAAGDTGLSEISSDSLGRRAVSLTR